MKYLIVIETTAEIDLRQSYEWGIRAWGKSPAQLWFRTTIREIKALASLPERCPLAPESEEFNEEIRQKIIGRYRVLFTIKGKKVHILHLRGAYAGEDVPDEDE